mmetsp:Transcript_11080/g.44895  ORF Transcript_11080/g.44895 Transcript_11080/m.44895 type:complete len:217 (+) Transcript_11080:317-967(+)
MYSISTGVPQPPSCEALALTRRQSVIMSVRRRPDGKPPFATTSVVSPDKARTMASSLSKAAWKSAKPESQRLRYSACFFRNAARSASARLNSSVGSVRYDGASSSYSYVGCWARLRVSIMGAADAAAPAPSTTAATAPAVVRSAAVRVHISWWWWWSRRALRIVAAIDRASGASAAAETPDGLQLLRSGATSHARGGPGGRSATPTLATRAPTRTT